MVIPILLAMFGLSFPNNRLKRFDVSIVAPLVTVACASFVASRPDSLLSRFDTEPTLNVPYPQALPFSVICGLFLINLYADICCAVYRHAPRAKYSGAHAAQVHLGWRAGVQYSSSVY